MRRAILSLTLLPLLMASASPASAGGLDIRLGAFAPRADSNLFMDDEELYIVTKSDWVGFTWGGEYNHVLVPNLEIGIHVDGYSKTIDTSYRDFVRPDESEIYQTLKLNIVPFGLTVRLVPTSKRTKFAPYIGGGVDLFYYKYEEWGDFIDFWDPLLEIYPDHFVASGVTFGFHAAGGLRIYLNRDFALVAEGRYQWAEAEMGGDFSPNEPGLINFLDLSGASFTLGLHVRF
jgi:hypothetical protein